MNENKIAKNQHSVVPANHDYYYSLFKVFYL